MTLLDRLTAAIDEAERALLRYRDGHEGPCRSWPGQEPNAYGEHDSCWLHVEVADATPYRDTTFGLRSIVSDRKIVALHGFDNDDGTFDYCKTCGGGGPNEFPTDWPCDTLRALAAAYDLAE